MDSDLIWAALALMLVFEGLFPLLAPRGWRATFERIMSLREGQLRFFGMCSVVLGLVLLWFLY